MSAAFVDCHSHVVPGVDDGARTLAQGVRMLERAVRAGTRLLYATPHVAAPEYEWTRRRRERIARRFAELAERAPGGLELRLGYEVTPTPGRLRATEHPEQFALPGIGAVLIDGPDDEPPAHDGALERYVRRVRACGLRPIVAHPERRVCFGPPDPGLAERLREQGALLQVDGGSLTGLDGPTVAAEARRLVAAGLCDLLGSDAHGGRWQPDLTAARELVRADVGAEQADRLCTGAALFGAGTASITTEGAAACVA
jgi:protein-tyrosine phosphatase